MIIPEDNKQNRERNAVAYGANEGDPSAPSGSRSQQPLFRSPDVEAQFDPPPVYSESTPLRGGEKGKRRPWRMLVLGSAAVLAFILLLSLRHGRSPFGRPDPMKPNKPDSGRLPPMEGWPGPNTPGKNRPEYDIPTGGDGKPVTCADYESAHWRELERRGSGNRRQFAALHKFTLMSEDVFAHLIGESAIGDIVVEPFASEKRDETEVIVEVMTVVESYTADFKQSSGWQTLMDTDVCEADRDDEKRSKGVVVNTRKRHGSDGRDLHFNITISVPVNVRANAFPFVRSLDMRSALGDLRFADLSSVNIGAVHAATRLGDVVAHHLLAQTVDLQTNNGDVNGRAGAWERLSAQSNNGDIDLDVVMPKVPRDHDLDVFGVSTTCGKPIKPVQVTTTTNKGDVRLRYGEWDDPCRQLSQVASTDMGDVKVIMNPFYEGPYMLQTNLGSIRLAADDEIEDPLGQGRQRLTRRQRHLGSNSAEGEVWWVKDGERRPDYDQHWKGNRNVPGVLMTSRLGDVRFEL